MFMFRLVVYLYDIRHEKASLSRSISYFFMLPNVCFPMFPVVDYKGFRRTYYDADEHQIYQTGVDWMVRGIIHLILYRVIYYYLTISSGRSHRPGHASRSISSPTFLLYLRISGDFHLITGMLHLFGFQSDSDASPLLSCLELHRLLAAHKYLLERLHDEDLLLPPVLQAEEVW